MLPRGSDFVQEAKDAADVIVGEHGFENWPDLPAAILHDLQQDRIAQPVPVMVRVGQEAFCAGLRGTEAEMAKSLDELGPVEISSNEATVAIGA